MKPFILNFSKKRIGEYKPIFHYDSTRSLNVVRGTNTPFIEMTEDTLLLTKTKVSNEAEDDGFSSMQLITKTRVSQEADDENISLLELSTKTFAKQESDD